jgi:ABC-type bacteriocin/lantibiotic exporter with double-glycine peptidase domain
MMLNRAVARKPPNIPVIRQRGSLDCATAAMAMILAYHGRRVPFDEITELMPSGERGVTAGAVVRCASRYGLICRGVQIEPRALSRIPRASILLWCSCHFIVFERYRAGVMHVIDPRVGRRRVTSAEIEQCFSGIVLVFAQPEGRSDVCRPITLCTSPTRDAASGCQLNHQHTENVWHSK